MSRAHTNCLLDAPVPVVFDYLADFRHMPDWLILDHVTPVGDQDYGLGAVYEASVRVGPKTLVSTFRISGWETNEVIVLESSAGFAFTSTVRLRPRGTEQTDVDVDLDYQFPGGIAGRALARTAVPVLSLALKDAARTLRRKCPQSPAAGRA